jgi:hypothetical protein
MASGGHVQVLSDRLCKLFANTKQSMVLVYQVLIWLFVVSFMLAVTVATLSRGGKGFYYMAYLIVSINRTNSDLCHLQHKLIRFYNRDEKCLLRGTDWVFK